MSVAKLKAAQKQLEAAAKKALAVLNEVSGDAFVHAPVAENPLECVGWIASTLKGGIAELEATAKYDGLDEEAIAALKAQERADEVATLRAEAAAALEAYATPANVPAEEVEAEAEAENPA